jgi:beta-glucuronidase
MFREQFYVNTEEMIDWHRNHPSIIMWGCLNECESNTPFGKREYARTLKLMRRLDGSRPVTYASHHHSRDLCYGLADIVSWNRYDAWYVGGLDVIEPALKDMLRWLHSPRSR